MQFVSFGDLHNSDKTVPVVNEVLAKMPDCTLEGGCGNKWGVDLSLLILGEAAPCDITPAKIGGLPGTIPVTYAMGSGPARTKDDRQSFRMSVTGLSTGFIHAKNVPNQFLCGGDSGGPLFRDDDMDVVVGVLNSTQSALNSEAGPTCAVDKRIDGGAPAYFAPVAQHRKLIECVTQRVNNATAASLSTLSFQSCQTQADPICPIGTIRDFDTGQCLCPRERGGTVSPPVSVQTDAGSGFSFAKCGASLPICAPVATHVLTQRIEVDSRFPSLQADLNNQARFSATAKQELAALTRNFVRRGPAAIYSQVRPPQSWFRMEGFQDIFIGRWTSPPFHTFAKSKRYSMSCDSPSLGSATGQCPSFINTAYATERLPGFTVSVEDSFLDPLANYFGEAKGYDTRTHPIDSTYFNFKSGDRISAGASRKLDIFLRKECSAHRPDPHGTQGCRSG